MTGRKRKARPRSSDLFASEESSMKTKGWLRSK